MILRRILAPALVLTIAGFLAFAFPRPAHADASQALVNVLNEMRALSDGDFRTVETWARNGAPQPFMSAFQPEQTESDILNLKHDDRYAVLYWLRGNGRSALYARGATDAQIGERTPASGPVPTPTPNAWRNLPLATASLDGNVQGNIKILGGFAAAERNGRAAIACVSFSNVAAKTANEIVIEFPLLSAGGVELGKLTLDRRGEFSPNVGIMSFGTMNDWQQGSFGPRSRTENCIERQLPTAALPILEARLAGYRIVKVNYDDGSSWTPAP